MAGKIRVLAASAVVAAVVLAAHGAVFANGGVVNSPHNLSVSGGLGTHKIAYDEIRVCVFCHTPHNAPPAPGGVQLAPLWNRALPAEGQVYTMYQSDSFNQYVTAAPSTPTGASRVCLSCHDGTLAMNIYGGPVLAGGFGGSGQVYMPTDSSPSLNSNLGTDLSDDHPISFPYTADLALQAHLVDPANLPSSIHLDKNSNLQCTACHDPHENQYGNFLVMNNGDPTKPNYNSAVSSPLCVACHNPPTWNDADNPHNAYGCDSCHVTHTSPVKQYLLNAPVDQVCYNGTGCHGSFPTHNYNALQSPLVQARLARVRAKAATIGGDVARHNDLETVFNQSLFKHPIGSSMGRFQVSDKLPLKQPRVECPDCHNAHLVGSNSPNAGTIKKSSLKGVLGVSKDGGMTVLAANEYQICYKCHSGPYAWRFVGINKPNRVIPETDQKKRFDAGNPSFHPVAALSRGDGRSLLKSAPFYANYQKTRIIDCSDCHNSDQSRKAGGNGPNGPHGSRYEHILVARYDMPTKGLTGRGSNCSSYQSDYALCFTCHSDYFVMVSGTGFNNSKGGYTNEHARHVIDRCIPCFVCHDPHGVPLQDGGSANANAHLINFDKGWAAGPSFPMPRYDMAQKSCFVACHATPLGKETYSPSY